MANDDVRTLDLKVESNEKWPLKTSVPRGNAVKKGTKFMSSDGVPLVVSLKRGDYMWLRMDEVAVGKKDDAVKAKDGNKPSPDTVDGKESVDSVLDDAPSTALETEDADTAPEDDSTDSSSVDSVTLEDTKRDLENPPVPMPPREGSGRPILVGVDGSAAAYKATWWAANYAKHSGLGLQIVVVYSLPSYAAVSFDATYTAMGDDFVAHEDAQDILSKAKGIAMEQGLNDNEVQTLIITGDASSVFVELSRNYDLIVVGNRGRGGLAERLLGTTSSTLPAYAYCPVVVVPYTDDSGEIVHLDSSISNVTVGMDDTPWGVRALDIAADLAQGWGAKLTVVSAAPLREGSWADTDRDGKHNVLRETYQGELDEQVNKILDSHPNLEVKAKLVGDTAKKALLAECESTDVIVVGSRGRGGLTGLLFGSTSQDLIHHSSKPVYVVPKKFVDTHVWKGERETLYGAVVDKIEHVESMPVHSASPEKVEEITDKIDPNAE